MIRTNAERSEHFFRLEREARVAIRIRTEELYERARRQMDLRIWSYPKSMQAKYQMYVEELFRDMKNEDLKRKNLIENQQMYLRLAHAYKGDR